MTSSPGFTMASTAVMMAWVAPAVTVISVTGSYWRPYSASTLAAIASRSGAMPGMGGYWLWPWRIASLTASSSRGSQSKSGKPWPRLTALLSAASADITVKIVVPMDGNLVARGGVRSVPMSEIVVIAVAGHRLGDQVAVQAIREKLREPVHEGAQVGAALERHSCQVLAEQMAQRPHGEIGVAVLRVLAHRHLGDDADAQAQAHVGLDHVGVDRFERDARCQLLLREGGVDPGPPREGRVIGDQRFAGQVFQRDALLLGERVPQGQHQHVLPLVAGQGHEVGIVGQRFGRHADLRHF